MPVNSCFTGSAWGSFKMENDAAQLNFDAGQPLDLKISLTMGQAFRWKASGDGWFSGVVQGQHIQVHKIREGLLEFRGQPGPDAEIARILKTYLRLKEDIAAIYDCLSKRDGKIAELVAKHRGLRILRQEPWECLIAYCCSAPNSVPQISRLVERLAKHYGEPIALDNAVRHRFPPPERLATVDETELRLRKFGLHARRISLISQEVANGSLNLDALREREVSCSEVRNRLKSYRGISDKIADCVSLFSLDKPDAFPIDRHIRNALSGYFPGRKTPSDAKLRDWALDHFGPYAGYAGQFLFYAERPRGK